MKVVRGSSERSATNADATGSEAIAATVPDQAGAPSHCDSFVTASGDSLSDARADARRVTPFIDDDFVRRGPARDDNGVTIARPFGVAGGVIPPESPLLLRGRCVMQVTRAKHPKTGQDAVLFTMAVPPLTLGGEAYMHALATSPFLVNLGPAILEGRVVIIPMQTVEKRESAVAMLNNALQILAFAEEKVDALKHVELNGLDADLQSAVRRVRAAVNDLSPATLNGALNDGARANALADERTVGTDERQLTLLDGGQS